MEKTPWFSSGKKPVRAGWYELKGEGFAEATETVMRYWTGKGWEWNSSFTKGRAAAAVSSSDKWRGLTAQAK